MAATDASYFPVKSQAFRATGVFQLVTTGKESAGALTALAAFVAKDGGAYLACDNAPAQVGTTGMVSIDLTATEMNAWTVVVKWTSTLANTPDVIKVINPIDMTELASPNGRADQGAKRLEQYVRQTWARFQNKVVQNRSSGAFSQYQSNGTTVELSGAVTQAADVITIGSKT